MMDVILRNLYSSVVIPMIVMGMWGEAEIASIQVPEQLPECPVRFIRGTLVAQDGAIWAVGEKESVYRLQVGDQVYEKSWINMDYYSGFPKGKNFTCVAEDKDGRIWVGTDDSGVAVFNEREWKMYDRLNALNGEHVYAIAASPVSGEVAVATSGGVSVYDPENDSWKILDRSLGLVEDQVASVVFDSKGNLWLGYAFGGISYSSRQSGYTQWKTVQAPWYWDRNQFVGQPYQPYGSGLPSNACNALCIVGEQVLVATCSGLGYSNGMASWRFMRGRDYAQKNNYLYETAVRKTSIPGPEDERFLSEDFVSAMNNSGKEVFIGLRSAGVDVLDAGTMRVRQRIRKGVEGIHISSLLVLGDGSVWAGTYGNGLVGVQKGSLSYRFEKTVRDSEIAFPAEAHMEDPVVILKRMEQLGQGSDSGKSIIFRGEDWTTKGDWCGKYGLTRATLCAANAPMNNSEFQAKKLPVRMVTDSKNSKLKHLYSNYWIQDMMGLNRNKGDGLRWWVESSKVVGNRNVLFDPSDSTRTEAEWDDHGEVYPFFVDGPNIWLAVEVPAGVHEISLYFYNPNGYLRNESRRDYLIEVRRHPSASSIQGLFHNGADLEIGQRSKEGKILAGMMEKWQAFPVDARTRVFRFAGSGVYKRFMSKKGGVYLFHICRNGSFNTILNGVFVNAALPLKTRMPNKLPYYVDGLFAGIIPSPEKIHSSVFGKEEQAFLEQFCTLQNHPRYVTPVGCSLLHRYVLSLWRAEVGRSKKNKLLEDWLQWEARISSLSVQDSFDRTMEAAWDQCQVYYTDLRSRECVPNAPGTIPFSVPEVYLMEKLDIDWRQYRDDAKQPPAKSVQEMKKYLEHESKK